MSENKKDDGEAKGDDAKAAEERKKKEEEDEEEDDAIELNPIKAEFKKSRIITFYDPPLLLMSDKVEKRDDEVYNLI